MELTIEITGNGKTVTITRDQYELGGTWREQADEIRRASNQAIGAFFADQAQGRVV